MRVVAGSRVVGQFCRLPVVGATLALLLLGMAAGTTRASQSTCAVALATGVLFHIGAYVSNDAIDSAIDSTDPRRSHTPLAAGRVRPGQGLLVAAVSLILGGLVATAWAKSIQVLGCYALASAGLLAYNLYGKRSPVPPVTDLVQGLGWGCLVLTGSALAGRITGSSLLLALAVCAYIAIVTGVHGGLRDLDNDARHDARTTALFFLPGNVRQGTGLPVPYVTYAVSLHVIEGGAAVAGVATLAADPHRLAVVAVTLAAVGQLLCGVALFFGMTRYAKRRDIWVLGFGYIVVSLWSILAAVLVSFGAFVFTLATAILIVPWLGSRVVRSLLGSGSFWSGDRSSRGSDGSLRCVDGSGEGGG